jgi:CheY-like chemotaxis protein
MRSPFRRPRILVLEDEIREARVVTRILEDEGYEVENVFRGEEALGRLADEGFVPYDLLLLDLHMPGMNGLHVLRFILNHRRRLLDRVIITSSASRREHPEMIGSASARVPWIRKPYRPGELVDMAEKVIGSSTPTAPQPSSSP